MPKTTIKATTSPRIIDYQPQHQPVFAALNYTWIERYFKIEASDRVSLEYPQEKILTPGGAILMAAVGDELVGTCALIALPEGVFELAKMAVSDSHQGQRIGWLLAQAAITRARELGARRLWLESNTVLTPAIALYRKLGFTEVPQQPSEYQRSNIQMVLEL